MSKHFTNSLAPGTSEKIYQQLLNVGTSSRKSHNRGKLKKKPAFTQGGTGTSKQPELDPDLHLEFCDFHYKNNGLSGEMNYPVARKQHNVSPVPSLEDVQEDSMIKMKKIRATSAYAKSPECYNKNPELFLSVTPKERRTLSNQKPKLIPWNTSHQALRFNNEWSAKTTCRATKRNSEVVRHRTDKMYILNGSALKLQHKYKISEEETQHLKELAQARQELRAELQEAREHHNRSRNISALRSRSENDNFRLPRLSTKRTELVKNNKNVPISMLIPREDQTSVSEKYSSKYSTLDVTGGFPNDPQTEDHDHPESKHDVTSYENDELNFDASNYDNNIALCNENDNDTSESNHNDALVNNTCEDEAHVDIASNENNAVDFDAAHTADDAMIIDEPHDNAAVDVQSKDNNDDGVDIKTPYETDLTLALNESEHKNNNEPLANVQGNLSEDEAEVALRFYAGNDDDDYDDRLSIEDHDIAYQSSHDLNNDQ